MSDSLKPLIAISCTRPLTAEEAKSAFSIVMDGQATDAQIAGLLMAMRTRGETVEEIAAVAKVMRNNCEPVKARENAVDVVGTGGDGKGTLNISTAAALVVAGAGVPVAKHGNRNLSSQSGAADVLAGLGVNVMVMPKVVEKAIESVGIGFMMAPMHHPAMRHVMTARKELGIRTVFNILGPLTNPAGVKRQLTGAYSRKLLRPMAEALSRLGTHRAWIVHGRDGTDELSICGATDVVELKDGKINEFRIEPADAGLSTREFSEISGGSPEFNTNALKDLLAGKQSAYRESVLLNAAAALLVAGHADSLYAGVEQSQESIDSGKASECAKKLAEITSITAV